jgi:diguanylate cyclase (GGDEF)-like protein
VAKSLIDEILAADNLPSLPRVAMQVLDLVEQDNATVSAIAEVIEKDPALTARVLKMVNSSLFGLSKTVGSLQQATVVLGLRTVKVVALSFSLVESIHDHEETAFDYDLYWRRSLSTAVMAKLISHEIEDDRGDESFVGGLLCDIGLVAGNRVAAESYAQVWQAWADHRRPIQQIEQELLETTHADIGAALLNRWNLPDTLVAAVGMHHSDTIETDNEQVRSLATTLNAASAVAEVFCGDVDESELVSVTERAAHTLGIRIERLRELMEQLDTQLRETAHLFHVSIGTSIPYHALRERAMTQLAALSISAEREREHAHQKAEQAESQLKELSTQAQALARRATHDPLTKIPNRAIFQQRLSSLSTQAEESRGSVGVIMLDIDHFKKLNDEHGHQAGDEALRNVGQLLRTIAGENLLPARYGGEEFSLVTGNLTPRALLDLAEAIRTQIEEIRFTFNGDEIHFTASLGACHVSYENEIPSAHEIVERADECLYDAKRSGRNRVEITH